MLACLLKDLAGANPVWFGSILRHDNNFVLAHRDGSKTLFPVTQEHQNSTQRAIKIGATAGEKQALSPSL